MSLLLDARKKSQQAKSAKSGDGEPSVSEAGTGEQPNPAASIPGSRHFENPRSAGQNLFNAKYPAASFARPGINRNLLLALGGTLILLSAGAAYVWYAVSDVNTPPQRPVRTPTVAPLSQAEPAPPQDTLIPGVDAPKAASRPSRPASRKPATRSPRNDTVQIAQHSESIDLLLNDAYLAYRNGNFEQSQQLYREALKLDERNTDALLGLAAIAQHRDQDNEAAHYYARALVLDPRNAVANAGMSALTNDDNRESRLKNLLNEQKDSSSLHFALGNHYAAQERWGEAQQSYSAAYKLEPGNAELAFNLAVSLDRLEQKKPAAQYYQRALQLDQSNSAGFDHAQIEQRVQELTGIVRSAP